MLLSMPFPVHAEITQVLLISSEFELFGAQPWVCKVESEAREHWAKKQTGKNPASWVGRKDSLGALHLWSALCIHYEDKEKSSFL